MIHDVCGNFVFILAFKVAVIICRSFLFIQYCVNISSERVYGIFENHMQVAAILNTCLIISYPEISL